MAHVPSVVDAIEQWVSDHEYIEYRPSTGGWERWAQCDFSAIMRLHGHTVHDEDFAYANAHLRDDITIDDWNAVVELKCWSHSGETLQAFGIRVQGDINKLNNNALAAQRQGHHRWAIALVSIQAIKDMRYLSRQQFEERLGRALTQQEWQELEEMNNAEVADLFHNHFPGLQYREVAAKDVGILWWDHA